MQKIEGSHTPAAKAPEPYDLKVGGSTTIDEVQQRLVGMWASVINERIFENPVLLSTFFGEYAAYVGFYASLVDQLMIHTANQVEQATNKIYLENPEKTVTYIDGLVRRTERMLSKLYTYHENELKSYNRNINAMQTKLRLYGDEAKTMGSGNA